MFDYSRRRVLTYGGAAIASVTFGGLAWNRSANAQTAAVSETAGTPPVSAPFAALAKALTGSVDADPALIQRVYASLSARYPDLDAIAPQLVAQLKGNASSPLTLSDPHLQEIYAQSLQALYLGIIGPAKTPKCIAFENIVSYKVVANAYYPPSYCSGQPGFWVNKPSLA